MIPMPFRRRTHYLQTVAEAVATILLVVFVLLPYYAWLRLRGKVLPSAEMRFSKRGD